MPDASVSRIPVGDGCVLRTVTEGEGTEPVVLLHGGPGWPDYLDQLAGLLTDRFLVHRFDQRASGRSDHDRPWTLERFVADVAELRAAFGHDRWHVVGHSWGATLGLLYALSEPDRVSSLTYLSGTGLEWSRWLPVFKAEQRRRLTPDERTRFDQLRATAPRSREEEIEFLRLTLLADAADRDTIEESAVAVARQVAASGINYQLNRELNDQVDALDAPQVAARCADLADVPTLVVQGQQDPRPVAAVDSLVAAIPHADVHVLAGAGHDLAAEAPPDLQSLLHRHLGRAAADRTS